MYKIIHNRLNPPKDSSFLNKIRCSLLLVFSLIVLREVCVPCIVVGTPKNQEGVIDVVLTTNDVKLSQLMLYFQCCLSLVLTSDASIKKRNIRSGINLSLIGVFCCNKMYSYSMCSTKW